MDESRREEIANFRFGVIAPMVTRQLAPGEQAQLIREASRRPQQIEGSERTRIHTRTIERWIEAYRKGGWAALKPAVRDDRGAVKALPPAIVEKAVSLRRELPSRSVEQVIRILELNGDVAKGVLKRTTLGRHLRASGAGRRDLLKPKRAAKRFSAPHRNAIWQGDCQHTLYLPDPTRPKRRRKAYLIAFLDDYSRLIVHGEFYFEEKRPKLEDAFKKAISRYGLPETFYCDNGAVYSSEHLARICGELAVRLIHSKPYKPQGRGKIEKFFWFVDKSFVPEAYALINQGSLQTLHQLNELFWAWLEVGYHQRKHSSLGMTPRTRYERDGFEARRVPPERLREIFLWREDRTVDKTGCIHVFGNVYEVDPSLVGQRVQLRYDPYDLSMVHVSWQGRSFDDAQPVKLGRTQHRDLPTPSEASEPTGLNYLELARRELDSRRRAEATRYRDLKEREGR